MQIPFQICIKGKTIAGVLHIPSHRAKGAPTIIMCYGLNGDRVEVHRMSVIAARQAEELGVTFVRFDYRGLGLSDGEFWQSTIDTKVEDALGVVDFIRNCFQSEEHTIILLGFCDGVRVCCKVAELLDNIYGLAMWNPTFSPMPAVFRAGDKMPRLVREPITKELVHPFFGLFMGSSYLRQVNSNMSMDGFRAYNRPKLLVFAENDLYSKETREEFAISNSGDDPMEKIVTIPKAKHLFNSVEWTEQVISDTLTWAVEVGAKKDAGFI